MNRCSPHGFSSPYLALYVRAYANAPRLLRLPSGAYPYCAQQPRVVALVCVRQRGGRGRYFRVSVAAPTHRGFLFSQRATLTCAVVGRSVESGDRRRGAAWFCIPVVPTAGMGGPRKSSLLPHHGVKHPHAFPSRAALRVSQARHLALLLLCARLSLATLLRAYARTVWPVFALHCRMPNARRVPTRRAIYTPHAATHTRAGASRAARSAAYHCASSRHRGASSTHAPARTPDAASTLPTSLFSHLTRYTVRLTPAIVRAVRRSSPPPHTLCPPAPPPGA